MNIWTLRMTMEDDRAHDRFMRVRGAKVHNLKNVDADIPLGKLVGIAGVSGSGKSSLALGVLYAEGSRRYLEALSTYTRRRISQTSEADVESIENVPAALALHQRPAVPGIRSTFGTMTELLNVVRLMYSRLGSYLCPNGHRVPPSPNVALGIEIVCPVCGAKFDGLSAEDMSFNSGGACRECSGTGMVRTVDDSKLIPDDSLTLRDGAVAAWNQMGIQWMYRVAGELGVRMDTPYRDLTPEEKDIVMNGPEVQRLVMIPSSNGKLFELNCNYRNAHRAVEENLSKAATEKAIEKVGRFLTTCTCSSCRGTRLNATARSVTLDGTPLTDACAMSLEDLCAWIASIPGKMDCTMSDMATSMASSFESISERLLQLGLGYLSLDREGSTLSTGERQRVQLARSVRSRLTGAMYVLDEPSIGLHPSNVEGLLGVIDDLLDAGNTVVMVDHDVNALRACDMIIEIGPGSGEGGGRIIASGTVDDVSRNGMSLIGPFLAGTADPVVRDRASPEHVFDRGAISMRTGRVHTVHPLDVRIPRNRLTVVTGVSGSGKTTMVLESLVPALESSASGSAVPDHVEHIDPCGISRVQLIDATPIGSNVRSTVATYCGVLDDLRRLFSSLPDCASSGLRAGDFSYNTGKLRCPVCDGTGTMTLDIQFLPDVEMTCPGCGGSRYSADARRYRWTSADGTELSVIDLMGMTVDAAAKALSGTKASRILDTLSDLGLGYLTLGESTPSLSGGEAQRLKLASEMGRTQNGTLFVFDEPTIGLHPLDVRTLISVFDRLLGKGATLVVIEHDMDMIVNADHIVDMGPGGGISGGTVVAAGTPEQVASDADSLTGRFIADALRPYRRSYSEHGMSRHRRP